MKKIISILLCFVLVLSTAACSFSKTLTEQYADIVEDYENQYGIISKERNIIYGSDALGGLSYIDLIDFNGDGIDELLLIFDQCTNEKVMEGALTCHIYAEQDGKAIIVYDENLPVVQDYFNSAFIGRTLWLSEDGDKSYIVIAEYETKELLDYPQYSYNYGTDTEEVDYEYDFKNYIYLGFDGTSFSTVCKTGFYEAFSEDKSDFYMVDDSLCSEQEYNNALKDVTQHIECSTYFYNKINEHNNAIKQILGLTANVVDETTEKVTTITTAQSTTEPTTEATTEKTTTTTSPPTTTEPTINVKKDMTLDEIADAIAAHYTAQRTDGGGFRVFSSEAEDMGDYYLLVARNVPTPEEEAEMDRLFREEGIIPSANVLAFTVTVEKATGKVVRSSDNDTWYLW